MDIYLKTKLLVDLLSPIEVFIPISIHQLMSSIFSFVCPQLDLQMEFKVGVFWVKVPCRDNVGSCLYTDVCNMLPVDKPCPNAFNSSHVPCRCPIPAVSDFFM
jgi:hypothetical protein